MVDFEASARLCESQGFVRPAAMLRARSAGGSKVYLVVERRHEYSDSGYWMSHKEGLPCAVFLDRLEAERSAETRNIEAFRRLQPFHGDDFVADPPWPTLAEIEEKIGAILGTRFHIPVEPFQRDIADDPDGPTVFPPSVTDDQMRRILGIFDRLFFHVEEAEVAPSVPEPTPTRKKRKRP